MTANYRRVKPSHFGRLVLRTVYDAPQGVPKPLGWRAKPAAHQAESPLAPAARGKSAAVVSAASADSSCCPR